MGGEQTHTRQGGRADARDMADVDAVHDVIQQVDHLRHDGGDHQLEQELLDVSGPHVLPFLLCLCHWADSPLSTDHPLRRGFAKRGALTERVKKLW